MWRLACSSRSHVVCTGGTRESASLDWVSVVLQTFSSWCPLALGVQSFQGVFAACMSQLLSAVSVPAGETTQPPNLFTYIDWGAALSPGARMRNGPLPWKTHVWKAKSNPQIDVLSGEEGWQEAHSRVCRERSPGGHQSSRSCHTGFLESYCQPESKMLAEGLAMYKGPGHEGLCSRVLSVSSLRKETQRNLGPERLSRKEKEMRKEFKTVLECDGGGAPQIFYSCIQFTNSLHLVWSPKFI